MPTTRQDSDFRDMLLDTDALDKVIAWIAENLSPGDVFSDQELGEWATDNGYVEEQ